MLAYGQVIAVDIDPAALATCDPDTVGLIEVVTTTLDGVIFPSCGSIDIPCPVSRRGGGGGKHKSSQALSSPIIFRYLFPLSTPLASVIIRPPLLFCIMVGILVATRKACMTAG